MISKKDIEKIKKLQSKFVSFKYIDLCGHLLQVDTSIQSDFYDFSVNLNIINDKSFSDPFRSVTTTSIFCTNPENTELRKVIHESTKKLMEQITSPFYLDISFLINNPDNIEEYKKSFLYCSDPLDKYSNLRSDIIDFLEKINIKCTSHYHGHMSEECVIGITGNSVVDLADNFIISKFIIENIAESYGKRISFSSGSRNLEICFMTTKDNEKFFLENIKINSEYIAPFFCFRGINNTQILPININNKKIIKFSVAAGPTFNPYIAFGILLLYGAMNTFKAEELFNNDIVKNYRTLIK
jgi:hypothetical protein